jgi:hypothetical protein
MKLQESHPRSHGHGQKRNEHGQGQRQDNEIYDRGGKPDPESRVAQIRRSGNFVRSGCGLSF